MGKGLRIPTEGQLSTLFDRLFYCPACTTWRLPLRPKSVRPTSRTNKRCASTLASSTAINATKPVPEQFKPLYDSLLDVRKNAPTHINTSRLQLALQGLESSNPTIRLAILGLNIPDTARRIARLLQADALEDEGTWERQLAEGQEDYSRGLIIRYGESRNPNIPRPQNSIPVLHIPAQVLERNNVELYISSVHNTIDPYTKQPFSTPSDTFLAPVIAVPTSFDGRQTIVSQPVHKCLLVARGLDELLAASQLLASTRFSCPEDREAISLVVDLNISKIPISGNKVYVVNTTEAEQGLAAIRDSVSRATEYEHKWIDSGMPAVSTWLARSGAGEEASTGHLPQSVRDLILSVLKAAGSSIEASRLASSIANSEQNLSISTRINLEEAIETFSRAAHQELQSGLASAWSSRNWRKLAWYKLFWRVDDVGLIITDLVTNAWLPKTERAAYEFSGRLQQVGINPVMEAETSPISEPIPTTEPPLETQPVISTLATSRPQLLTATSALVPTATTTPITSTPSTILPPTPLTLLPQPSTPIPTLISQTRNHHISHSITTLQTTAQQLLFRTLTLTSLTTGLSLLTHFSFSATLYESGTIAAIGTVYALYRMQGDWLRATRRLEDGLYNAGREVIVDVVERMRLLVKERGRIFEDAVEVETRERAKAAVERARGDLDRVDSEGVNGAKKV